MKKRLRRKINKVLDYKKVSTTLGEQYIKYFKKLYIIVFDDVEYYYNSIQLARKDMAIFISIIRDENKNNRQMMWSF